MDTKKYICNICNKTYKTYKSMWHHKNKYHPKSTPESKPEIDTSKPESTLKIDIGKPESKLKIDMNKLDIVNNKKYKCKFCLNEYKFKQSKWNHEQKCNKKNYLEELIKQNEMKDKEIEEIKISFEKFKKQMIEMMNKKCKMHPKTLQKIINSNNNNLINSNNNITINNIKYVEYGKEDLPNIFTKKEKLMILKSAGSPIENIVRYTHLNDKYPQFQNIIITNVRSNQAYAYNEQFNKFILCDKNELLDEMMVYRYDDLIYFFEQYSQLLSPKLRDTLNKSFLLKDDSTFCKNKYKDFNVIIYNECNKDNIKYKNNDDILENILDETLNETSPTI
jgi:hypothetical protein